MPDSNGRIEGPMALPRAFSLLRLLADHPHGLSLSDIANRLDVPKSSLLTTLKGLTDQQFLDRKGLLYSLGTEAYSLASAIVAGRTLRQIARPFLERAMEETGETVLLAELDVERRYAVYIDAVESGESVRYSASIATRRPLYCSSAGRVFLAHMPDRARALYYESTRMERLTDRTEIDRMSLEEILREIREKGISVTMGVFSKDAAGFSTPIFDGSGAVIAAAAINVPISRAERNSDKFEKAALKLGSDISRSIGYRGPAGEAGNSPKAKNEKKPKAVA